MTHRFSTATIRIAGLGLELAIALAVVAGSALTARANPAASAGSHKAYSVSIVNHDFGADGARGSFSAKLGPAAHVVAALMSAVTGVPYNEIAKGGTSGPYDPSKGYLVATGSMKMIGGTGAAAHWKGNLTFNQTGVTGRDTLLFKALTAGSMGRAHGLTAACKAVAKLKG